jgi:FkbM family methyltransferase
VGFAVKTRIKFILQRLLGLDRYLLFFAVFRVFASRFDGREAGLFRFVKLLPDDAVVLDIGANIGVTSTIIQRRANPSHLVAFEPLPLNLRTLRSLFGLFDVTAEVVPGAVGDRAAVIEMILPEKDGVVLHGLGHLREVQEVGDMPGATFKVQMTRLDDSRHLWGGKRVDGIKIDVENAEALVLSGATEILQNDRPIVYCELWDNENRRKCIEIARETGYTVKVLSRGRLEEFDGAGHTAENFFLVPEERRNALDGTAVCA